ncbi:endonuclease domain-containing protein [Nesterenkonia natronophila]|uniref:DUF559 domain-containing protein n=1 Tax=Nesterenkonia natronophila TaxID=2174932 RepID=A0A3A4F2D7_9MICC|nr:hypothetical protein [Nesterenkonia natronophila]RJN31996.1 hypothetical protein D3250_07810 [Nesterenkonia natronophila]
MRPPKPLPPALTGGIFTRTEARQLGVSSDRLRARDIQRIAHATYRHLGPPTETQSATFAVQPAALQDGDPAQLEMLRALCRRCAVVRVSHVTAALLHGLPLPRRWTESTTLHLTGRSSSHASVSDPGVRLHRTSAVPQREYCLHGVPVSPPPELFVELARYLRVPELVVVGDQLVRTPRAGLETRVSPWSSLRELEQSVRQGRGRLGILRAREALRLVRVGADSPPETRLRLALISAGLPEPQLQIPLKPNDPFAPVGDAGYRSQRLVIQYEGEHHFTPEQQARDQRRNAQFEAAGWTVMLANRVDLRENFQGLAARVKMHFGAR